MSILRRLHSIYFVGNARYRCSCSLYCFPVVRIFEVECEWFFFFLRCECVTLAARSRSPRHRILGNVISIPRHSAKYIAEIFIDKRTVACVSYNSGSHTHKHTQYNTSHSGTWLWRWRRKRWLCIVRTCFGIVTSTTTTILTFEFLSHSSRRDGKMP